MWVLFSYIIIDWIEWKIEIDYKNKCCNPTNQILIGKQYFNSQWFFYVYFMNNISFLDIFRAEQKFELISSKYLKEKKID